jgi:hypothetical protein
MKRSNSFILLYLIILFALLCSAVFANYYFKILLFYLLKGDDRGLRTRTAQAINRIKIASKISKAIDSLDGSVLFIALDFLF